MGRLFLIKFEKEKYRLKSQKLKFSEDEYFLCKKTCESPLMKPSFQPPLICIESTLSDLGRKMKKKSKIRVKLSHMDFRRLLAEG